MELQKLGKLVFLEILKTIYIKNKIAKNSTEIPLILFFVRDILPLVPLYEDYMILTVQLYFSLIE